MLKQLSQLLKSKEIKKLLENFFSLSVLKLINAILPFVTLPYLIKVLGFKQYGAIVLGLSLIAYFQAITDYGFNLSATREIAKHKHSQKQLSYIYSKTIISKIILLIFSLFFLYIIVFFIKQLRTDAFIYILMSFVLIGQTLFPEWFFRGIEKMRYITIMDLIVKMGFVLGVFLFIKKPNDYWIYPLILGGSYIFVSIFSHLFLLKNFRVNLFKIKPSIVIFNLRNGFPLFLNQFVPNLFNNTTNFLIGMVLGKSEAGVFGAARQVVQILTVFNSVVSSVFFPYLVKNNSKFDIYRKYYFILFVVISLIFYFINHLIFNLLGIHYYNLNNIVLFLVLGAVSIVLYSIYSTNYLIARGEDKTVMKITVFTSLFGLVLAAPLIKYFGVVGGAFNIFICQFILGVASYFLFRKHSLGKYL